jgi:hypothetical protein
VVGNESHIDIGLSDEKGLHSFSVVAQGVIPAGIRTLALVTTDHSLKLFA